MGYDAASLGNRFATFRDNLVVSKGRDSTTHDAASCGKRAENAATPLRKPINLETPIF
jgi:hypothetical protein